MATNFRGDCWWTAWYYVDERVVRRTTDEDTDPREGKLLECRTLGRVTPKSPVGSYGLS